jgi:hypothetical protein
VMLAEHRVRPCQQWGLDKPELPRQAVAEQGGKGVALPLPAGHRHEQGALRCGGQSWLQGCDQGRQG